MIQPKKESDILLKIYNAGKDILNKIKPSNTSVCGAENSKNFRANNSYDFKESGSVLWIKVPHINDNYEKLSKFVMEYPQKVVGASKGEIKGFIIIIDEFQFIGELKSPEAFFWMFRSFTQEQDNVSYIFTGSTSSTSDIVNKINGINGAFGNRMIQLNVDPFTQEETERYLKEKVSEIEFTKDSLNRFYKCTRGYPAYINSSCNTLSTGVTYDNSKVIHEFYLKLEQVAVKWIFIWSTLSKHEKCIITTIIDMDL